MLNLHKIEINLSLGQQIKVKNEKSDQNIFTINETHLCYQRL